MLSVKKEDFLDDLVDDVVNVAKKKRGKYPNTFQNQFTNRRINAKYIELASRYAQFADDDEIFGQMVMIIMELVKDKEYIKISKTGRNDEISWIITTTEQRMWDYIQKNYTMNFISRINGEYAVENNFVSFDNSGRITENRMVNLDDYTYIGNGNFISNHEIYDIGDNDPTEYEYMLGLQRLDELMDLCRLVSSQKDLVLLLDSTRDSETHIYNQNEAAKLKGVTNSAINKGWKRIQAKMKNVLEKEYSRTNEEKMLGIMNDLMDEAETERDVLMWIKENSNKEFVLDILLKLDGAHRRQIIRALKEEPVSSKYYKESIFEFLNELHGVMDRIEAVVITHE